VPVTEWPVEVPGAQQSPPLAPATPAVLAGIGRKRP